MAQEPPLESQTHLVAHLMRELNGGLLGALEPMVPSEDWPEKGTADRQAKMIVAVCDALRVPADDPLRRSWKTFSRKPAELAHRCGLVAPRPVDREFEDYWDHVIAERLAQLAGENVIERIEILRLMVERGARDWFVIGSRERIEAILLEGLASGGQAMSQARDLINVIVARGNLDFADLLGGAQDEEQGWSGSCSDPRSNSYGSAERNDQKKDG